MTMPSIKPVGLTAGCGENRKASKPLIEKRRRARINYSLAELKAIVVGTDQTQSPTARQPKLEKADILEMAVAYVKKMHEKHSSTPDTDPSGYTAGFNQCLLKVCQFLDKEIDQELKSRLMFHLNSSPANPINALEPNMDETSSSCSSNSRSHTPASIVMETSQTEYFSSSPFTDSEQEVPRTFPTNYSMQMPSKSSDNYHHNSFAQFSTRPSMAETVASRPYQDSSSNAVNRPLNLATNAAIRKDDQLCSRSYHSNNSKSHLGFFHCNSETDNCMWRPWNSKKDS